MLRDLILFSAVCASIKASSVNRREDSFKCWFGEPVQSGINCDGIVDPCPQDYVCVTRYDWYGDDLWSGCCPAGSGPCHAAMQRVDPSVPDWTPPTCLDDGTYAPEQCYDYPGFCYCVLPNGQRIDDTMSYHGEDPVDCDAAVEEAMKNLNWLNFN